MEAPNFGPKSILGGNFKKKTFGIGGDTKNLTSSSAPRREFVRYLGDLIYVRLASTEAGLNLDSSNCQIVRCVERGVQLMGKLRAGFELASMRAGAIFW